MDILSVLFALNDLYVVKFEKQQLAMVGCCFFNINYAEWSTSVVAKLYKEP